MLLSVGKFVARPVQRADVASFASRMRRADIEECWASCRAAPGEALSRSVDVSTLAWAGFYDGRPLAMFGVAAIVNRDGVGVPWMLGTDLIETAGLTVARQSMVVVRVMSDMYPVLMNYVHDRNTVSKRWLQWLGFTLGAREPWGQSGEMFRPFVLRRAADV